MKSNTYDVFISYSHKDRNWVIDELLNKLESHGFSTMIDFRDFKTGAASVEEMERAVINSKKVIIVLTTNYLSSEWAKFENIMAQTLDLSAMKRKIIPILKKKCDIPLRLRMLTYRDLRTDDSLQWDLLIRDLL